MAECLPFPTPTFQSTKFLNKPTEATLSVPSVTPSGRSPVVCREYQHQTPNFDMGRRTDSHFYQSSSSPRSTNWIRVNLIKIFSRKICPALHTLQFFFLITFLDHELFGKLSQSYLKSKHQVKWKNITLFKNRIYKTSVFNLEYLNCRLIRKKKNSF